MKKRIGILGGLSIASTVNHYLRITRKNVRQYGTSTYPELLSAVLISSSLETGEIWPALHDRRAILSTCLGQCWNHDGRFRHIYSRRAST